MKTVTEQAYGKINLYLDVLGKREDGYHDIESVMQTVSLCDTVTITEAEGVSMTCSDPTLTCGEDNLCMKAARAFFSVYPAKGGGCRIELTKTLPREAGLGGGSADAAAVLRALNRMHGEPFSSETLCAIGAKIGADVPFCVQGKGAALAEGIGEILSPFPALPDCHIVITNGIGKVSTPRAYRALDETAPTAKGNLNALKTAMKTGDLKGCGSALYNRFEDALPVSRTVVDLLLALGAEGARMTGSGAAVFGLFSQKEKAAHACAVLETAGLKAYLAWPVRYGQSKKMKIPMTSKELYDRIDSLTHDISFVYRGKMGGIVPLSRNSIFLYFGGETRIQANSVEAAMTIPFVDGKTLDEVAEELYVE